MFFFERGLVFERVCPPKKKYGWFVRNIVSIFFFILVPKKKPEGNFALLNLVTGVVCERVMELARQLPPATSEEKLLEYDILKQQVRFSRKELILLMVQKSQTQPPGMVLKPCK